MGSFARPENALKTAEDLITVGQKEHALQTLHDIITSKRNRMWSKVLEDIMKKYVQLCVDMRKGKFAKEGLHQYKIICQQVNVNSLEVVIKHFLQIAENCAKDAQSKAQQTILDIEDLETEESAESIILTAVSGEDRTDRTDREIVTPWLRFLWETYRTVLETLRNSAKLEALYHETAQQAFNFCLRYQRKNEFRRLSDILRNHLTTLGKYPNQPQTINLNNPETLQIHLETRFAQLKVATELELWQEAFRSVEDIHGLMTMSHKPISAAMMATYFHNLARIFWVSNNYLFHAYAWFKYFVIARPTLKDKPEEIKMMASSVLLAALSIPLSDPKSQDEQFFEYDIQKEKNLRMGVLLGFTITPKREYLLQDLLAKKAHQIVYPELQDIYAILEKRFNPLQLCQKMTEKFEFIRSNPNLAQYEGQLQKLTFLRLIQQLSQVYSSMKIEDFRKMVSFMDAHSIEKLLVSLSKRRYTGVRIDHQNHAIHFGGNETGSDQIRDQLSQLAKGLQDAAKLIHPKAQEEDSKIKNKREAFVRIINSLKDEQARVHARNRAIEERKIIIDRRTKVSIEEKVKAESIRMKKQLITAAARALAEQAKRVKADEKRKAAEAERIKNENLIKNSGFDPSVVGPISDPLAFLGRQQEEALKTKHKHEEALKELSKQLLYKDRAHRENEKKLLEAQLEQKKKDDQAHYEALASKSLQLQQEQWAVAHEEKTRLSRMSAARAEFEGRAMAGRESVYKKLKAEQTARVQEILAEKEVERKRRAEEDEIKRKKQEEARREQEERDRVEREREAAEQKKREEEEEAKRVLAEEKKREEEEKRKKDRERIEKERERIDKEREEKRKADEEERQKRVARETSWRQPAREEPRRDDNREREPLRRDPRDEPREREGSWRGPRDEPRRDESRSEGAWRAPSQDSRREDPRREDSRRDDFRREDPRRDDSRREDSFRAPARREEPRREDSGAWRSSRRDEEPRNDRDREGAWRAPSQDSRREEPRREDSRREDFRREEPRREDSRREEPRREDSRREEPRREDSRREEPRREEPRREDSRREEPRREDSRRDDSRPAPAWGRREESGSDQAWRKPASEPERREPERKEQERPERRAPERREPERREPERREPERRTENREAPRKTEEKEKEREPPAKEKEEKEAPAEDGFTVAKQKRRR